MKFWGIQVKPGQTVRCEPPDDHFLHLSQGALGESEGDQSGVEATTLYVKVNDGEKMTIGTLSADKFPQVQFDLSVEKGFELSHSSKTEIMFFCGYNVSRSYIGVR